MRRYPYFDVRRLVPLFAAAGLLIQSAIPAAGEDPVWSGTLADQVVSFDDNEYARAVQVLVTGSEEMHAFWGEDAPSVREIHYGRSTDHGPTWPYS